MLSLNSCSGHDGCNVSEDIAHRSIEYKTVDWLVEGLGSEEGDGNEGASCQGQDRPNSLKNAEVVQLRTADIGRLHGGSVRVNLRLEVAFRAPVDSTPSI
jgi:hypothetical protein